MNLNNPIYYIKGVSNVRASLLSAELGLTKINDLLHFFPFRYIDRTKFYKINANKRLKYNFCGYLRHNWF